MTRAEARHRAITESWGQAAEHLGLDYEILVPPPAEDRTGRLAQVLSGQAQGVATGGDRVSHRLHGRIDDLGVVAEIRRETEMGLGGNPDVHVVTRYRAEAPWLPKGVRVANRNHRRPQEGQRRIRGLAPAPPPATHLTGLALEPERAGAWLDERRVGVLHEAMTATPDLLLVDRAVRAATKGEESDADRLSATLRAVMDLARALR